MMSRFRRLMSLILLGLVGTCLIYVLLFNFSSSSLFTTSSLKTLTGLSSPSSPEGIGGGGGGGGGGGDEHHHHHHHHHHHYHALPGDGEVAPPPGREEKEEGRGGRDSQKVETANPLEGVGVGVPPQQEEGGVKGDVGDEESTEKVAEEEGKEETERPQVPPQTQTSDKWPVFSKDYFPGPIPPSPFRPNYTIRWDFDTAAFLRRPDVKGRAPKLMTWMVKTRYMPPLPEPVRLRVCPEMPCRLTTNQTLRADSAALLWAGQIMREEKPPVRTHPDQVYVFHNHEPQTSEWVYSPSFRKPAWRSAFNWTMHYRFDADIVGLYGYLVKRRTPLSKNYTDIVARKTKLAVMMTSHCSTPGKREKYVELLKRHMPVDVYGGCSDMKCPRSQDDSCFQMISSRYKFFFAFENAFCKDYISEKFFRYLETDAVVVARGSNEYKNHAPPGIFINTADFKSTKALADHLLYLDTHPEAYMELLKAKDSFQPLYEDWVIRSKEGKVQYMHYHYEAVSYCEMCRRLWELDHHRKTMPDIAQWVDRANCYPPQDLV